MLFGLSFSVTLRCMQAKQKVQLGAVQETALLTLYGRAWVSQQGSGLLNDASAVEIVRRLDFDFAKWNGLASLTALAIRARVYDEQVQAFLAKHPEGSIVELGVGLNTRFERVDRGTGHWLELDLPDTIELRRVFFKDCERRRIRAFDLTDENWVGLLSEVPAPYLFVSEGALIYLAQQQVRSLIGVLARTCPGSQILVDTASTHMVENQAQHDAMRTFDPSAWFRWKCDDPLTLEPWGMRCLASLSMSDVSSEIRKSMPLGVRFVYSYMPWLVKKLARGYRINLFELDPQIPAPSAAA